MLINLLQLKLGGFQAIKDNIILFRKVIQYMNPEFHVTHTSHKSNFIHSLSQCFKISDPNIRVLVCWIQHAICKDLALFKKGWSSIWLKLWTEAIPYKPTMAFRKIFRVTRKRIECNPSSSSLGVNGQMDILICKHIQVAKFLNSFILNWRTMLSLLKFSFSRRLVNTNCLALTKQELLVTSSVSSGQELIRPTLPVTLIAWKLNHAKAPLFSTHVDQGTELNWKTQWWFPLN